MDTGKCKYCGWPREGASEASDEDCPQNPNKPLDSGAKAELLESALRELIFTLCGTDGGGVRGNPYCNGAVKSALKTLKRVTGFKGDYLDVNNDYVRSNKT